MENKDFQIHSIDKDWWKEERASTRAKQLVIAKKVSVSKKNAPLLTVKDIAHRLNVGIWSIYDYIAAGELECQIVGRRKRISEEALAEFLILQNQKFQRKSR